MMNMQIVTTMITIIKYFPSRNIQNIENKTIKLSIVNTRRECWNYGRDVIISPTTHNNSLLVPHIIIIAHAEYQRLDGDMVEHQKDCHKPCLVQVLLNSESESMRVRKYMPTWRGYLVSNDLTN